MCTFSCTKQLSLAKLIKDAIFPEIAKKKKKKCPESEFNFFTPSGHEEKINHLALSDV